MVLFRHSVRAAEMYRADAEEKEWQKSNFLNNMTSKQRNKKIAEYKKIILISLIKTNRNKIDNWKCEVNRKSVLLS